MRDQGAGGAGSTLGAEASPVGLGASLGGWSTPGVGGMQGGGCQDGGGRTGIAPHTEKLVPAKRRPCRRKF